MNLRRTAILVQLLAIAAFCVAGEPEIAAVTDAVKAHIAKQEVAGAITLVATRDKIVHLSAVGHADVTANIPMTADNIFWIASMTKPITGCAILLLQDDGKLSIDDLVEKYIPELADMKTADGKTHKLTIKQLLTHTSGLAEVPDEAAVTVKTLTELIPYFSKKPLLFEPGSKWQYNQSGLNTLGRIVEVVSGMPYGEFLDKRLFAPLGMKDTSFFPTKEQLPRIAKGYKAAEGKLTEAPVRTLYDPRKAERYPAANGGLFSTIADYALFAQMLLNKGSLNGKQYLKPETVTLLSTIHTGELKTGFTTGHGWGLGACVVREPQGVTAMLSPGSFGHGGAWGTQAWIDPVKGRVYILLVQRANFPNSDNSDLRKDFQTAAAEALGK